MNKNNIIISIILTIFCMAIIIGSVSANENVTEVISTEHNIDELKTTEFESENSGELCDENNANESSESDLIALEKTADENIISQSADNDTVSVVGFKNETILGETETSYIDGNKVVTTLKIKGVKDYYYYGETVKFRVYHSCYINGKSSSSIVLVSLDEYGSYYGGSSKYDLRTGQTVKCYARGLSLGLHTIYTTLGSDPLDEVNFYVLKNPVKFSKATKTVKKYKPVKKFKITAKLANGKPLSRKYIFLKINGKTYKAKTTSKGIVTFKILLPKKTKTYRYKVKYYGNYGYKAKTYRGKLRVR